MTYDFFVASDFLIACFAQIFVSGHIEFLSNGKYFLQPNMESAWQYSY